MHWYLVVTAIMALLVPVSAMASDPGGGIPDPAPLPQELEPRVHPDEAPWPRTLCRPELSVQWVRQWCENQQAGGPVAGPVPGIPDGEVHPLLAGQIIEREPPPGIPDGIYISDVLDIDNAAVRTAQGLRPQAGTLVPWLVDRDPLPGIPDGRALANSDGKILEQLYNSQLMGDPAAQTASEKIATIEPVRSFEGRRALAP
jgi:hypothetical protein